MVTGKHQGFLSVIPSKAGIHPDLDALTRTLAFAEMTAAISALLDLETEATFESRPRP